MNYKLAKELKDAGFPQHERLGIGHGDVFLRRGLTMVYLPTLSELIEACDLDDFTLTERGAEWLAGDYCFHGGGFWVNMETGKTPEEAVAKLWLALNSK